MRRSGEPTGRGDILLVAGCTTIAFIALLLPRAWGLSISAALRRTALRPIVAMSSRAAIEHDARFGFAQLQHERDSLALLAQQQQALARENDELRKLMGLRGRLHLRAVSADVLHQPTMTGSRILPLNVGSADGVQSFDPVVTADGIVGYIVSVSTHSSMTYTWDNSDFAAGAASVDGKVHGFVHPSEHVRLAYPSLELRGVALGDSMKPGTVLLTTSAGGTFPRGIPIGTVVGVQREVYGYDRVYRIAPFTNPNDVSHVIVLISPRDSIFPAPPPTIPQKVAAPVDTATPAATPFPHDTVH